MLVQHHEAWVLIKNGAGTRFLRPASASELRSMADAPRLESEVDPITMEPYAEPTAQALRRQGRRTPLAVSYRATLLSLRIGLETMRSCFVDMMALRPRTTRTLSSTIS